jgi:hypothetical protein
VGRRAGGDEMKKNSSVEWHNDVNTSVATNHAHRY